MNQIILDRFTSATDLKNRTKFVLDKTDELGEVFIVNNNKPRAVLLSIRQYNDFIQNYNPILGDLISMSEKEKNKFDKSKDSYLNGDFISEEEFFSKLS